MRPYLAVIQDSFREALASRVLWVLLVLITLLLLALAPFGYRPQVTCGLGEHEVREWPQFILHVRDAAKSPKPSPSRRIVESLDEPLRNELQAFRMPGEGEASAVFKMLRVMQEFRQALNQQLARRDFYDRDAWGKTRLLSEEGRELAKQDVAKLSDDEVGRWNRLALEAAFPDYVAVSPPTSVRFRYLGYDVGEPLPIRKSDFRGLVETIVERVTKWLVGTLGVFVAVLVTASIIPQTFDPGSLNLLLSKPIRRSLLFLAKFLGGCMFILLNASYLVLGAWLILGCRFGLWNGRILLCIPVYVFVFAIYYTVSALTGLLWRNAIASVIVTIVFWLACFVVGVSKSLVESMVLNKTRIVQLIPAQEELLSADEMGLTHRWNDTTGHWDEVFRMENEEHLQRRIALAVIPAVPAELRPVGPVYDEPRDQLVSAVRSFNGQMLLQVGPRQKEWQAVSGGTASLGTRALLREADGRILVVSSLGLYRLVGDPKAVAPHIKLFGFSIPAPASDPFVSIGPDPAVAVLGAAAAAINRDTGELAIYSRGLITLLRTNQAGRYERRLEHKLGPENPGAAVLAFGGDTLLVGRDDGQIIAYDAQTLEPRQAFAVEGQNQPRFVTAAPGGRTFAVVFHHGTLWIYDRDADELFRPPITGQRDISGCVFPAPDRVLVADRATRVTQYELPTWQVLHRYSPPLSLVETIYRYALSPLYTVFPKPGELDKTVQYLLSGKETAGSDSRGDLATAQQSLHPWRPVWSSLAFMVVVLACGCLYLERQDF
ncbi:MAG: ABC transporter permease subunit [Planctomycetota bacterium]|nr:ABC transporter permease subunit [Planctomycetota bacterium]